MSENKTDETPALAVDRLLSFRDLKARCTLSRSTVWRYVQRGEFPKPIKVTDRRIAWRESDVTRWLDKRAA